MKKIFIIILSLLSSNIFAQQVSKIFSSDIDNFWIAYDSIQKTNDFSKKIEIINRSYINKGTKGLKAFMAARDYNDTLFVNLIDNSPKFWNSVRPNTQTIKNKIPEIEKAVTYLKEIYPELKDAEMYFTIGGLRSGGTVSDNMVLIGTEIATGNSATDVSEFKNNWLKNVFSVQSLDNIVSLNMHEYIHTQQKGENNRVLSQCIKEGACDFIAELAIRTPLQTQYLTYGRENADKIKALFKAEMFSDNLSNWLYNGSDRGESADLGYYIGYEICKSYYDQSNNKSQAIKDIIQLNYDNDKEVEDFLYRSGFYQEQINKKELISAYNKHLPYIVKIEPFKNNSKNIDAGLKELRITFSKGMMPKNFSISFSDKGKDYFPITKVKGFENEDKTIVLELKLQPAKDYEFIITNRSFRSKDGYPLKENEYPVKFKTK